MENIFKHHVAVTLNGKHAEVVPGNTTFEKFVSETHLPATTTKLTVGAAGKSPAGTYGAGQSFVVTEGQVITTV